MVMESSLHEYRHFACMLCNICAGETLKARVLKYKYYSLHY